MSTACCPLPAAFSLQQQFVRPEVLCGNVRPGKPEMLLMANGKSIEIIFIHLDSSTTKCPLVTLHLPPLGLKQLINLLRPLLGMCVCECVRNVCVCARQTFLIGSKEKPSGSAFVVNKPSKVNFLSEANLWFIADA